MKKLLSIGVLSALLVVGCGNGANGAGQASGAGAADWPGRGRSVDLLVGFAAGGTTDNFARAFADELSKQTGARITVANREGAATQLAQQALLAAPKDGYTMSMVNLPALLNYIYTGEAAPFDLEDFEPIAGIGISPDGLVVRADSPYKSLDDVVAAIKASPAPVNAGANNGMDDNMAFTGIERAAGKQLNRVVYDGTPDKIQALLNNDIQFFNGSRSGVAALLQEGQVRIIAQWGQERSSILPDVPTAREQGYDFGYQNYGGFAFAAGVPEDIRSAAEATIKKLSESEEFRKRSADVHWSTDFLSGADFRRLWQDQEKYVADFAATLNR